MTTKNATPNTDSQPVGGKKYFTVDEANRSLTYVSRIVDDIRECYHRAVEIRQQAEQTSPDDIPEPQRSEYERIIDRLNDLIDELQQAGVELKDIEMGLLDFPAIHDGREIYLCWHLGEEKVRAWHEIDAGFAGRQDVDRLAAV